MLYQLLLTVSFLTASYASSLDRNVRKCPNTEIQQNFELKPFEGVWYLRLGRNVDRVTMGERCARTSLIHQSVDGPHAYHFFNQGLSNKDDAWLWVNGTAWLVNPENKEGLLSTNINNKEVLVTIVNTDYRNYAIAITCKDDHIGDSFSVWVVSRDGKFASDKDEKEFFVKMDNLLKKQNIDPTLLTKFDQENCPY